MKETMISQIENEALPKPEDYYSFARPEMLAFMPEGCKAVLDVGCSNGQFLKGVKSRGIYCVGIEPHKPSSEAAKNNADIIINTIFTEDAVNRILTESTHKEFDCIFFNDVLEHLEHPWQALELCKKLLSPKGVIIASIPNFLFYSNILHIIRQQDFFYQPSGILDITHLRFFTRKSIIRMFESSGFLVNQITGINPISTKKFDLFNRVMFNKFKDWKYIQFSVVAQLPKP
jgi:2-polyprenyl-3-methyl-5-hydroxy-6-metoxy-1,4-benzoquinol methylase